MDQHPKETPPPISAPSQQRAPEDELRSVPLEDEESQAGRDETSWHSARTGSAALTGAVDAEQPGAGANDPADLESNAKHIQKPAALKSLRYYIMLLALVSPFIVTYSRTIINFAIIDMIDPNYLSRNTRRASAAITPPVGLIPGNQTEASELPPPPPPQDYFDLDNSCPVDELVRARLLTELASDERRATETTGEKFQWDTDKQGYLKAAYAIGHIMLQVVGGRLSEIYGSQVIMSLSACLIALCCLSAPFLASAHFYLLFGDLFVLGMLGSFMTPSLITLISNWLTPGEKSLMMSFYLVSSRLGYALSSLLCGLLIDAQLSWRYLFYSAGWVGLVFGIVFFICSRNRPQEHPLIGQPELDYLASKNKLVREALARRKLAQVQETEMQPVGRNGATKLNQGNETKRAAADKQQPAATRPPAPWLAILTNLPVWAFIITKFCVKLMGDTVQTELPVYLKRVMHMPSKYNGYINSANYVIFCISCMAVGTLAKWANKQRPFGCTKTTVRKVFQCTASFGVSLVLLGVSLSVCHETVTLVLFMTMFFLTTFSTGGEAQIPLDLSERYAGTIHAIGGTLAISGAIEPIMVGQFLLGHGADRQRWANIWLGASAISFAGGLIFLFLGDATIQPFDELHATNGTEDKAKANGTIDGGDQAAAGKQTASEGQRKLEPVPEKQSEKSDTNK